MSQEHDDGANMNMTPSDSMSNGSMNMKAMMMHMSLYWGKDVIVLFSGWPDQKLGMYVLALLFIFLLALAVEFLSILPAVKPGTIPIVGAFIQATVYAFRMGFAYLVMLSVMSFNLGIFIAAVAGHAVGFFIVKSRALAAAELGETMSSGSTGISRKV
jgi:copper transporter 1